MGLALDLCFVSVYALIVTSAAPLSPQIILPLFRHQMPPHAYRARLHPRTPSDYHQDATWRVIYRTFRTQPGMRGGVLTGERESCEEVATYLIDEFASKSGLEG